MEKYVFVKIPMESREKLSEIAANLGVTQQDAGGKVIDEYHRVLFSEGKKEPRLEPEAKDAPKMTAASKGGYLRLRTRNYTSAMSKLPDSDKAAMLDAIFAYAGAEYAKMPKLSPMAEMAISYIFDEMDRYSAMCKDKAEVGRAGGLASSKSKRLKRAE